MGKLDTILASTIIKTVNTATIFCKKKENKVTYISYRSNILPQGMKEISSNLRDLNPEIEEKYLTFKFENTLINKVQYALEVAKQTYHIKTSDLVFIDGNNFVVSNLDTKDTKIIQLWHASGAIKKFGMDYKRKYTIKNYDYLITSSSKNIPIMARAFGMNQESILTLGYADTDILFNDYEMEKKKKEILSKYPQIKDKKVILYAPTFRGDAIYDKQHLEIDLGSIIDELGDEYFIIYKMHPILGNINLGERTNLLNLSHEYIYDLFAVSDLLISDYSSIIYDFSILEKPIILHAPDLSEYESNRGLYVNYNDFTPYPITKNNQELIHEIKNINRLDKESLRNLKNTFFDYLDGKSAERIAAFTTNLLSEIQQKEN